VRQIWHPVARAAHAAHVPRTAAAREAAASHCRERRFPAARALARGML